MPLCQVKLSTNLTLIFNFSWCEVTNSYKCSMLHGEANLQVNLKFDVPFTPKKKKRKVGRWG